MIAEADMGVEDRYPVVVIDDANHGQVASGDIPTFVTDQDVPSPITFEEAHIRYASAAAAFIVSQVFSEIKCRMYANFIQEVSLFNEEQVENALTEIHTLEAFTQDFLQPFIETSLMESGIKKKVK